MKAMGVLTATMEELPRPKPMAADEKCVSAPGRKKPVLCQICTTTGLLHSVKLLRNIDEAGRAVGFRITDTAQTAHYFLY